MKKTLSIICCYLILISCSHQSKIEGKVEEYVQKNFNDPSSYELIELRLIDTVSEGTAATYIKDAGENYIRSVKEYVAEEKRNIADEGMSVFFAGPTITTNSEVKALKKREAELEKYNDTINMQLEVIKTVEKYINSKKPLYVKYEHNYRAKDDKGVLLKSTDTLRFDMQDNMIKDKDDFILKNLR